MWINGERKGVAVRPGMTDDYTGQPIPRLQGPLRWAVDVEVASVEIDGPLPPPARHGLWTTSG